MFISNDAYERKHNRAAQPMCSQLWLTPQVNWDGKLLGCCINRWGDFGNVFSSSLVSVLRSSRYRYAKKMLLGEVPPDKSIPCFYCPTYKRLQSEKFDLLQSFSLRTRVLMFFSNIFHN